MTERLPKSLPYQTLGGLLLRDIRECLDAVTIAITAAEKNPRTRLECIDAVILRMTSVKTTMRALVQTRQKNGTPVVSPKQEAAFLDLIQPIATQAGAWRTKTAAQLNAHV